MFAFRALLREQCLSLKKRHIHLSGLLLRRDIKKKIKRKNSGDHMIQSSLISNEALKNLVDSATIGHKEEVPDDKWLHSPYHNERVREQAAKALRPKVDPRETSIILFPGQGVQYVGMGKSLLKIPLVEEMYKKASEILGYDLLKLCLSGPKHELDLTKYCQPAIFVASLAAYQLMIEERQNSVESCVATAGFSVGEYAALVLANAMSFETGLELVRQRAELMQTAAEQTKGGMMTLFLSPAAKMGTILNNALEYCLKTGVESPVCSVANYLFCNCKVIGGNEEALKFIEENRDALNIRKCMRVPVSGAFHTKLMQPAALAFKEVLRESNIIAPQIPVHSNVDGCRYRDASDIKSKLVKQIYKPVKWEQTMRILYDREKDVPFPQTFELGPKNSLKTILSYNNANAAKYVVNIFA